MRKGLSLGVLSTKELVLSNCSGEDSWGFPGGLDGRENLPAVQETQVQSLGQEDPLKKGMATHSSILAWSIPWAEELVGYSQWGHRESDTAEVRAQKMF